MMNNVPKPPAPRRPLPPDWAEGEPRAGSWRGTLVMVLLLGAVFNAVALLFGLHC